MSKDSEKNYGYSPKNLEHVEKRGYKPKPSSNNIPKPTNIKTNGDPKNK